ncbi:MAG: hypothetical protein GDA51_01600 [Ekhidna sp.]|nr:hypothetical protein [Ekhidna sp.]MBC6411009.1 hypothetical protein [Ekhidna sp.]MBC6425170.1 hypothetical protein [Ekhidna sp.]
MKNIVLPFLICFILPGCNDDNTVQQENLITENATLFYYFDAGFGTSQCYFVVETQSNKIFVPNKEYNLSEFTSDDGSYTENNVKITYRLTDNGIERCFHREGFLESPTVVIEIKRIEKI